jgi:NhaP-type Na+/H+ or K+/H+ antiporter
MLLLGLPGVIVLGTLTAAVLFDNLSLFEAAILGTMLAATDAALGKAVITNQSVPTQNREGLNFESGLNDGLCVPILLVFIALAIGGGSEGGGTLHAIQLVIKELGIGLLVGLGLTAAGCRVGLSPTGKRRLSTAHTHSGRLAAYINKSPNKKERPVKALRA